MEGGGWREPGTDRPTEAFKDADLLWPQLSSWRDRTWGAENPGARGKGERGRQASTRRGCVEGRETEEDGRELSDEKGCDSHFCSANS